MIARPSTLKKAGILGMNARINRYMNPQNKRRDYPRVDNKVNTALLCTQNQIPIPDNYFVFEAFGQLRNLEEQIKPQSSFVIKPARGSMGNGILVIRQDPSSGILHKPNGKEVNLRDLRYHIQNIMSGLYSLTGHFDQAIMQYCIQSHPAFKDITYQGVPDIRIIVYLGFPVMAMIRLPTAQSDGRANLHQGAVGLGLDIKKGISTSAVLEDRIVTHHPDTAARLQGRSIPFWSQVLDIAFRAYEVSRLGYLGVDIALDATRGPLLLEMNARPGLSIQIANQLGLRPRLMQIEQLMRGQSSPPTPSKRLEIWQNLMLKSQMP